MLEKDFEKISASVRVSILKAISRAKSSHIGSCLSIVDILVVLYFETMKVCPKNFSSENRDIFVLSKGHAAVALYSVLSERGFFNKYELLKYGKNGTKLSGHIIKDSLPGVEISSGSLGHGLSVVAGMALTSKCKDRRFFCLMGDGECNEGSVWEAAMFAGHRKLNNLIAIVDFNGQQGMGKTEDVISQNNLADRFRVFGWDAYEIDGHNFKDLSKAFKQKNTNKPIVIIAHTIKGKGVSFMEDKVEWHYKSPTKDQLLEAVTEIKRFL